MARSKSIRKCAHDARDVPQFLPSIASPRSRGHATQVLKYLIKAGSKLDARDHDGYAPIHYAADEGNLRMLHELVAAGSSPNWLSNTSQTPLAIACLNGHPGCVKYLLDRCKVDPGAADNVGYTPLAIAAQHGHFEAVEMLLKFGVSKLGPNAYRDALSGVAMVGNVRMIRMLVLAEGGVHLKGALTTAKMTPMHYTAGYCHPLATALLLESGGDEYAADIKGKTPIDVVDTMRSEHVQQGLGRRRIKRMLAQGPAYRARSWQWPSESAESALLLMAESAKDEAEPTKNAAESTTGTSEGGAAEDATETVEMTDEDFDLAFDAAMAVAAESPGSGKVDVTVYCRPMISSSGAGASRHPAVVASLFRYVIGARLPLSVPVDFSFCWARWCM